MKSKVSRYWKIFRNRFKVMFLRHILSSVVVFFVTCWIIVDLILNLFLSNWVSATLAFSVTLAIMFTMSEQFFDVDLEAKSDSSFDED